jgi:MFS family permease
MPSWRSLILINIYWLPLALQDSALLAIAVPAEILRFDPHNHHNVYAVLVSVVALVNTIVPALGGVLSDRLRRRTGTRGPLAIAGGAINVIGLLLMPFATSTMTLAAYMVVATFGLSISTAAYQAMLPDSVPRASWGLASGIRGAITLVGTVAGLAIAGTLDPRIVFFVSSALVAAGAASVQWIRETAPVDEPADHAKIRDWHDFIVVFIARGLVTFGLTMLMTFVLYFLHDMLHVHDASLGTGIVGLAALFGAAISAVGSGKLSDVITRKYVVVVAGIPMTLSAVGFAILPRENLLFVFALLFGLGYGSVISTGWALALDSIPDLRDVARDLGIWGLATHIPSIIAPIAGAAILSNVRGFGGYQIIFALAAASFAAGSVSVLFVRDAKTRGDDSGRASGAARSVRSQP